MIYDFLFCKFKLISKLLILNVSPTLLSKQLPFNYKKEIAHLNTFLSKILLK